MVNLLLIVYLVFSCRFSMGLMSFLMDIENLTDIGALAKRKGMVNQRMIVYLSFYSRFAKSKRPEARH